MSEVVIDSGILIAAVYPETLTPESKRLINQFMRDSIALHAPTLQRYELIAVSRKAVFKGRVTVAQGELARDKLLNYPIMLHFDDALLRRGYELATAFNRPTAYDAQYLALAERLSCDFWTADERLFNAVSGQLSYVKWAGNL